MTIDQIIEFMTELVDDRNSTISSMEDIRTKRGYEWAKSGYYFMLERKLVLIDKAIADVNAHLHREHLSVLEALGV
jgi:hypothetical protein